MLLVVSPPARHRTRDLQLKHVTLLDLLAAVLAHVVLVDAEALNDINVGEPRLLGNLAHNRGLGLLAAAHRARGHLDARIGRLWLDEDQQLTVAYDVGERFPRPLLHRPIVEDHLRAAGDEARQERC